jgi:hypothetical protein
VGGRFQAAQLADFNMSPSRLADLSGESGVPLPHGLRKEAEQLLGADFRDVRLHHNGPTKSTHTFSVGYDVFFADSAFSPDQPTGRVALLHELAHVAQRANSLKGLSQSNGYASAGNLERESSYATVSALHRRPYKCKLCAPNDSILFWGVAGHYYTVYYTFLAAGVNAQTAQYMAFMAQLPDQVEELDATRAGIDFGLRALGLAPGTDVDGNPVVPIGVDIQIQTGLHCLTGRSVSDEKARRLRIMSSLSFGSPSFGLSLHPFGDLFAHRLLDGSGAMYSAVLGHAVEAAWWPNQTGHEPDFIFSRPELYLEYGLSLYLIARLGGARQVDEPDGFDEILVHARAGASPIWVESPNRFVGDLSGIVPRPNVSVNSDLDSLNLPPGERSLIASAQDVLGLRGLSLGVVGQPTLFDVGRNLLDVASRNGDGAQIARLRSLSGGRMSGYRPEGETLPWDEFFRRHALPPRFLDEARRYARNWS